MKTRRTKIGVFYSEIETSWGGSQLKLIDSRGDERKEVWIHIERPSDVEYIKEQLDKIVAEWRKQLASLSPTN